MIILDYNPSQCDHPEDVERLPKLKDIVQEKYNFFKNEREYFKKQFEISKKHMTDITEYQKITKGRDGDSKNKITRSIFKLMQNI